MQSKDTRKAPPGANEESRATATIDLELGTLGRLVTGRATIVSLVRFHWRGVGDGQA